MAYLHGIRVKENPTSVPTPVSNEAGVPVIFGTAPVNLADDRSLQMRLTSCFFAIPSRMQRAR